MKLGLVVGLVLAARAAHADEYPTTFVDRPLNLLPGMTSLDVSEQVSSFPMETFGHQTPDVIVFHGFGPLEVGAELGQNAVLHLSLTTHSFPESIEILALSGAPQKDHSLHLAQALVAGQRFHVVPGALAITAVVGATVSENRLSTLEWTQVLAGYATANVELQILPHQLALFAGPAVNVPITTWGGPDFASTLGAGGGVMLTLGTWDIYVSAGARDITHHATHYALPYLDGGFTKRWGA
jgi:hypothetical protein